MPRAARKIRATLCPKVQVTDPEFIVMGGEDTCVYIYDISKPGSGALVLNQLQVSYACLHLTQMCSSAAHVLWAKVDQSS